MKRTDLAELLTAKGQSPWTTRVRLSGLMMLVSYIATTIKRTERGKASGVPCSNRLARQYSGQLRTALPGVVHEPLAVLVHVGVLEVAAPAKVNFHMTQSARYRLAPAFQRETFAAVDRETNNCVRRKLADAPARLERGLNRAFPFRANLLRDLSLLRIPESAQAVIPALVADKDSRPSTRGVLNAIASQEHTVTVKPSGLIVTSMISCPRPLKPLLHLAGQAVALCDISSAHWMFLPRVVADRIAFCSKRGDAVEKLAALHAELDRLLVLCSSGSFYGTMCREGASPDEIKKIKRLANILLNSPESRAAKNVIWRGLHRRFPLCLGIISAIKRDDHRHISRQFQHFTAKAITAALLDLQAQGIPAIPDTDCLIVREQDRTAACHAIGKAMFTETSGVCTTVGGIKYVPQTAAIPAQKASRLPWSSFAPVVTQLQAHGYTVLGSVDWLIRQDAISQTDRRKAYRALLQISNRSNKQPTSTP